MPSLFSNFDFSLLKSSNFKEDAVREEIITPILNELEFYSSSKEKKIIRSKKLVHPFVSIGSNEKRINIYPDYLLEYRQKIILVLDAKAPSENIHLGKNVNQVYSYAIHPEIRCEKYALCNGNEITFFKTNEQKACIDIEIAKINDCWDQILQFLFEEEKVNASKTAIIRHGEQWYLNRKLPDMIEKPKKQATRRHFGVHGYFTKQSWDIVSRYIQNFTQKGDTVLDPFGGSGVTLIESLINYRQCHSY